MKKHGDGVPFTSFGHWLFVEQEVAYKQRARRLARKHMKCSQWNAWSKRPGRIVGVLKTACSARVSANLLEHQYVTGNSDAVLYQLKGKDQKHQFESHVRALYRDIKKPDDVIEKRFNALVGFLKTNKLSCMRPERFFPIKVTHFENVLRLWGIGCELRGKVEWSRYKLLLDTADELKGLLLQYGTPSAIDLQSYIWFVSNLKPTSTVTTIVSEHDFAEILQQRQVRDAEKQRIGLLGEQYVFEHEQQRLIAAGKTNLSRRVTLISAIDEDAGYDVLSFDAKGHEIHIEVKSTTQSPHDSERFWISENEVRCGDADPHWCVWRVWNVDTHCHHENLGNIVKSENDKWTRSPSTWIVQRNRT
jgi:hypothetical protein